MPLSEHGLWARITSKAKKGGLLSNRIRLSEEGESAGPAEDVIGIPAIEIDGLNGQQARIGTKGIALRIEDPGKTQCILFSDVQRVRPIRWRDPSITKADLTELELHCRNGSSAVIAFTNAGELFAVWNILRIFVTAIDE